MSAIEGAYFQGSFISGGHKLIHAFYSIRKQLMVCIGRN